MSILFLRLSSWISGVLAFFVAMWQWSHPLTYPWPMAAFLAWYAACLFLISWRRLDWRDALDKCLPSLLVLAAICLGFLMAETALERWVITILLTIIPFLVLELLFLLTRAPSRYPVNGLSRLNITLVPLGAFFLGATLNGLAVFVHIRAWIFLIALASFSAAAFFLTSHPTATHAHRGRWSALGAIVGVHAGLLGLLLPVGVLVHGALTSLFIGFPLRVRRYAYEPVPSRRLAWGESVLALGLLVVLMISSRWV